MTSQSQLQTVNYEEIGLSFTIPSGWTSEIDGDYMYLKNNTISGLIVIFENRSKSVKDLIQVANRGIVEEGVQLNSLNDFKEFGKNIVDGHYEGVFLGSIVKGYAIAKINNFGSGISILAVSEPNNFNNILKEEAKKIITSVVFKEEEESPKTKYWKNRIAGRRLEYSNTQSSFDSNGNITSGISDREALELFNDGSFYYKVNNQSFVNSETIRSNNNPSGEYRIVTFANVTYLQLFYNGNTMEFVLTLNDRKNILLNGRKFFSGNIED